MTPQTELATFIRTLLGAGLTITNVSTKPNFTVVNAERFDEFRLSSRYVFVYCTSGALSRADCRTINKLVEETHAALVIAGDTEERPITGAVLSKQDLLSRLGGAVSSLLPLEPNYPAELVILSSNHLPNGLKGTPDDLFEAYVHAGLQFLLRGRVLRFGQERRFEALPDGMVINSAAPIILYDCKAAASGYEITKDTIRQFTDYVNDYQTRYESYLGRPHAFLAVSSSFQESSTLQQRSNELYADCQVPLVCMTAHTLADCIGLFAECPRHRMAVDWRRIFVPPQVETSGVKKELVARTKDSVIR
jgi:hypothetical protein